MRYRWMWSFSWDQGMKTHWSNYLCKEVFKILFRLLDRREICTKQEAYRIAQGLYTTKLHKYS